MKKEQKGGFLKTALRALTAVRLGAKTVDTISKTSQKSNKNNLIKKQNVNRMQRNNKSNQKNRNVRVIDEKNNERFTIRPTKETLYFYTHGNSNTPVGEMHRNKIRNIAVNNNTLKITKTNNSSFTYRLANNKNRTNIIKNLST